jgi:hypothetical protein
MPAQLFRLVQAVLVAQDIIPVQQKLVPMVVIAMSIYPEPHTKLSAVVAEAVMMLRQNLVDPVVVVAVTWVLVLRFPAKHTCLRFLLGTVMLVVQE